jgi:hypothetical protein
MRIEIYEVGYQVYLLPTIKITHTRFLNGDYEIILGLFKWEIALSW